MTNETAGKIAQHFQKANEELGRAIQIAKQECSAEEFELWRGRLASVLGELFVNALHPLFLERPYLAPETFRDQYPLRRSD